MIIRPATTADGTDIADVYLAANAAVLPYLPHLHTDQETRNWFTDSVLPSSSVLVAVETSEDGIEEIVGFAALRGGWLEYLFLRPDRLRRGIGGLLLDAIKEMSPDGLRLFVFQRNFAARAFYRSQGFVPVAFASGADNEEHEPDLTMLWIPAS